MNEIETVEVSARIAATDYFTTSDVVFCKSGARRPEIDIGSTGKIQLKCEDLLNKFIRVRYLLKYTLSYDVVQAQFFRVNSRFIARTTSMDVDGWELIPPEDVANSSKSPKYRLQ